MGHSQDRRGPHTNVKWAAEESTLRVLKPSARAVIPIAAFYLVVAVVITWILLQFYGEVAWVASLMAEMIGNRFPNDTWFLWLLGIVWGFCLVQPLYRLVELKTSEYEFTTQRLRYTRGILNRQRDQIELVRIRDLTAYRSLGQRLLGLGTLRVESVDRSHPTFDLLAQKSVYELKDWIHELNARERVRLGYREYEGTQGIG
ncbi:PH domain-containing protein [Vreelandella olivaria]|uniref:PH domain-containing protein n=1 Tax=Vreelandella olivaria TaxID=390919 RepID=UPI00201EBB10|nr:PH domain-containing protein [Halomonas olivaria]